jgi:hypothetical protein
MIRHETSALVTTTTSAGVSVQVKGDLGKPDGVRGNLIGETLIGSDFYKLTIFAQLDSYNRHKTSNAMPLNRDQESRIAAEWITFLNTHKPARDASSTAIRLTAAFAASAEVSRSNWKA